MEYGAIFCISRLDVIDLAACEYRACAHRYYYIYTCGPASSNALFVA